MGNLCSEPDEPREERKEEAQYAADRPNECPSLALKRLGICSMKDYRNYVKKHHPDHGGDPVMFRRVQELFRSDNWDCRNDWRENSNKNPSCGSEMRISFIHKMNRD